MQSKIIVIGASAGGIEAVSKLIAKLPSDFPAPIFVVIHISPHSDSVLPRIFSRAGVLKAVHPRSGKAFSPGYIYVAPPDKHLIIKEDIIELARGPRENNHRPAIDVLFRTAALTYNSLVIGIVLSGTLDDGTAGLLAIKQQGGIAIVQDPDEALYSGMPESAIENVKVDYILPVAEMATVLSRLASESTNPKKIPPVPKDLEMESDMAELKPEVMQNEQRPGTPSVFACPDCGGVLWEFDEHSIMRFRCRTGHAFSAESLLAQQSNAMEEAMWSALRALEEIAALRHRMAERSAKAGNHKRAQNYRQEAHAAKQRALLIRQAILNGTNLNNTENQDESDRSA
jgi:two-component system, chemotaxis family, protein-glutamate methylesterase/glutaminase